MSHKKLVVGAIIVDNLDEPTAILAAQRSKPTVLAGSWEFPGGKVEDGEEPVEALERELVEELQIVVTMGDEFPCPNDGTASAFPSEHRGSSHRHHLGLGVADAGGCVHRGSVVAS